MNPEEIKDHLAREAAQVLLRLAVYFQSQHMQRLNVSAGPKSVRRRRNTVAGPRGSRRTIYTNPSQPGEYLHKRTGFGQASVTVEPTQLDAVAELLRVRVGYRANAPYMAIQELYRHRKGLADTLRDLRPQLEAMTSV